MVNVISFGLAQSEGNKLLFVCNSLLNLRLPFLAKPWGVALVNREEKSELESELEDELKEEEAWRRRMGRH